jgi:hypothetical protein
MKQPATNRQIMQNCKLTSGRKSHKKTAISGAPKIAVVNIMR